MKSGYLDGKMAFSTFLIAGAALLAGCREPVYDVAYYQAHQDAMEKKLTECEEYPDHTEKDPNCEIAYQAHLMRVMDAAEKE